MDIAKYIGEVLVKFQLDEADQPTEDIEGMYFIVGFRMTKDGEELLLRGRWTNDSVLLSEVLENKQYAMRRNAFIRLFGETEIPTQDKAEEVF